MVIECKSTLIECETSRWIINVLARLPVECKVSTTKKSLKQIHRNKSLNHHQKSLSAIELSYLCSGLQGLRESKHVTWIALKKAAPRVFATSVFKPDRHLRNFSSQSEEKSFRFSYRIIKERFNWIYRNGASWTFRDCKLIWDIRPERVGDNNYRVPCNWTEMSIRKVVDAWYDWLWTDERIKCWVCM